MDCLFEKNNNGLWQCQECNWEYPFVIDRPPHRNCPEGSREFSLERRIAQAVKAEMTGLSEETILKRLACCRTCKMFCETDCPKFNPHGNTPCRWFVALIQRRDRPTHACERWISLQKTSS